MNNITPILSQTLTLLQLLTSFGSLCVMMYGFSRFMAKSRQNLEDEVSEIQEWRRTVDKRLDDGNRRFDEQSEANRVTQNALLALVDKEIRDCDSRHQTVPQELTKAKSELVDYLTKR